MRIVNITTAPNGASLASSSRERSPAPDGTGRSPAPDGTGRSPAPDGTGRSGPGAAAKTTYILRLDKGEEFITSVQDFCSENDIKSGQIVALGSTRELQLAYFNTATKKYETKDFKEFLEIINITGNIALKENKIFCHAHGTFSRADMKVIGGHIMRAVISATCEIKLEAGDGQMERKFDDETGLYLLN